MICGKAVGLAMAMAVVAKWSGHRPGNHKVPGSMPGIDPQLLLCFLGQETYPSPSHPAVFPAKKRKKRKKVVAHNSHSGK